MNYRQKKEHNTVKSCIQANNRNYNLLSQIKKEIIKKNIEPINVTIRKTELKNKPSKPLFNFESMSLINLASSNIPEQDHKKIIGESIFEMFKIIKDLEVVLIRLQIGY